MSCTKLFKVFFNNVVRRALYSTKLGNTNRMVTLPQNIHIRHFSENTYAPKLIEMEKINLRKIVKENKHEIFSMILPPPNVTGNLHLGHFLTVTVEDVIAKWKYLNGYVIRWIPGTDHAGIATQVIVERKILNEKGLTKHELGRGLFLEEVAKWKDEKERNILTTLNRMGLFLQWDKQYFTMDKVNYSI